jgi:hypothetical protein
LLPVQFLVYIYPTDFSKEVKMASSNFEQILADVKQLPRDEQQKLIEALQESQLSQPKKKLGRRVPPPVPSKDRTKEAQWLKEHSKEYAGQWVALEGDQLIAHSFNANEVFAAADASGIDRPIFTQVEDPDGPPFAGGGV